MINSRIKALQDTLVSKNISAIIIPTQDFHMSEYVGEFFKARKYFSGFTGSAGTLVVTKTEARLWVDGRYFIQAPHEVEGSCIQVQKSGEDGVLTIKDYLVKELNDGDILAFDGRVICAKQGEEYNKALSEKNIVLYTFEDLVSYVWQDRPELIFKPAFALDIKYAGRTVEDKLSDIRSVMKEKSTDCHIVTALDDIAWIYNIRGSDVQYTPVVLAYSVITLEEAFIFADKKALGEDIIAQLKKAGVLIKDYDDIYTYAANIPKSKKVLLDANKVNYAIASEISCEIIESVDPSSSMKAIKNQSEIENTRSGHIQDCVALTKFMYWLKTNVGKIKITEYTAEMQLARLRSERNGYIDLSFKAIAGYGANAAMMHYSATEETALELKPEGMLLVDSGGQYYQGTTDVTRTFVLGDITKEQRTHFTAVVQGVLAVCNTRFLHGCRGTNMDIIAREPLWALDLDYKCGSGHGVGYLLNVHEGPNGFRWNIIADKNDSAIFEEGMITTIEPGVYIEGSHGIRIENEILCQKGVKNEYGQFMYFDQLTFAPIDLDGIDLEILSKKEKTLLNNYHQEVFNKISPYLEECEAIWLKEYTRAI